VTIDLMAKGRSSGTLVIMKKKFDWRFSTEDARIKLKRLYPSPDSSVGATQDAPPAHILRQ
jgi:hypothetical protein